MLAFSPCLSAVISGVRTSYERTSRLNTVFVNLSTSSQKKHLYMVHFEPQLLVILDLTSTSLFHSLPSDLLTADEIHEMNRLIKRTRTEMEATLRKNLVLYIHTCRLTHTLRSPIILHFLALVLILSMMMISLIALHTYQTNQTD
jgi:hypothetical protein